MILARHSLGCSLAPVMPLSSDEGDKLKQAIKSQDGEAAPAEQADMTCRPVFIQ